MKLDTNELLSEAKRQSRRVKVYLRENGQFEADGVILAFDDDTVSIQDWKIGVVHFIRENVDVMLDESVQ